MLVAHQRTSQSKMVEGLEERKKGEDGPPRKWRISQAVFWEDTEEMIGWRAMRQLEVDG